MNYREKYLKYKNKYLKLKNQFGGNKFNIGDQVILLGKNLKQKPRQTYDYEVMDDSNVIQSVEGFRGIITQVSERQDDNGNTMYDVTLDNGKILTEVLEENIRHDDDFASQFTPQFEHQFASQFASQVPSNHNYLKSPPPPVPPVPLVDTVFVNISKSNLDDNKQRQVLKYLANIDLSNIKVDRVMFTTKSNVSISDTEIDGNIKRNMVVSYPYNPNKSNLVLCTRAKCNNNYYPSNITENEHNNGVITIDLTQLDQQTALNVIKNYFNSNTFRFFKQIGIPVEILLSSSVLSQFINDPSFYNELNINNIQYSNKLLNSNNNYSILLFDF